MADVDLQVIGQRLTTLRKHLGGRLGAKLSIQDVAERSAIPEYKLMRHEHGKGSMDTMFQLLLFYRSHGYNMDWIVCPNNGDVPMMLASGNDLLAINELVKNLSRRLEEDYRALTTKLNEIGYGTFTDPILTPVEAESEQPAGLV